MERDVLLLLSFSDSLVLFSIKCMVIKGRVKASGLADIRKNKKEEGRTLK